jgi:hypothetical protein
MKKLGVAAVLLLVLLIVMWRSMKDDDAAPAAAPKPEKVAEVTPSSVKRAKPIEVPIDPKMDRSDAPKPTDGKPEKIDHMSDEFFYKFTERVPKVLTAQAATCYETIQGSLHRNAKLVLDFKVIIKNGAVTVHNVKVKHSDDPKQKTNSLGNPALESCFIQMVSRAGWKDETLPDYEWPDELVLRPERGMKGFQKSNLDYVGAEAPKRDPKAHIAIKPPPPPPDPKESSDAKKD